MAQRKATALFTEEERARIEDAVRQAEARTSGEIVPMVVDAAYDYPRAEIYGAGCFSLGAASLLAWGLGNASLWFFLPAFLAAFFLCRGLIRFSPGLKRLLLRSDEVDDEVEERALVAFFEHGLHRTRAENGILILVCLLEHRVRVLADRGIDAVVPPGTWEEVVGMVTEGVRRGQTASALCRAVGRCADLLEEHFPVRDDDRNELPDLILEES